MSGPSFRLFALLAACAATGPIQLSIYLPGLPLVQAEFGASVAEVQWTVSLPMVAFGLGLLVFGPLSDRLGRRPVLLAGLLLFTLASVIAWLAPGVAALAGARAVQSAGASIVYITARAVVADLTPREHLQRSVVQLTMVLLVGQMVAPLLGNLVMTLGGWRLIQAALTVAGAGLVAVVALRLRETRVADAGAAPSSGGLLAPTVGLLRRPGFARQFAQIGLLYASFPAIIAIGPHLMVAVFHRPTTHYGYYYALLPIGYFAGNAFLLRFGRRFTPGWLIRCGSVWASGSALLAALLLAVGLWHPLALFIPAALLLNFGLGIAMPSASARVIAESWPATAGAWSLAGFSQQVIGAVGVQVLGFFPADTPFPVLLLCASLAIAPALLERRGFR